MNKVKFLEAEKIQNKIDKCDYDLKSYKQILDELDETDSINIESVPYKGNFHITYKRQERGKKSFPIIYIDIDIIKSFLYTAINDKILQTEDEKENFETKFKNIKCE